MRKLKQALSLSLALVLSLALTVPAFAAPVAFETTGYDYYYNEGYFDYGEAKDTKIIFSDVVSQEMIKEVYGDDMPLFTVKVGTTITPECIWPYVAFTEASITDDGYYAKDEEETTREFYPSEIINGTPYTVTADNIGLWLFWDGNMGYGIFYLKVIAGDGSTPAQPEQPTGPAVSDWAKDQVSKAQSNNLIADGLGNDYRVNITRAQFAATAVKLYEAMSGQTAPAAGNSPFTDTSDPVIIQAQALGFVAGVGDNKFAPDSLVTREQAAAMLSRVYTKLGGNIPAVTATTFADNGSVSGWARDSVAFMADKGIVNGVGDNNFAPQGNASIEQALCIALRMFENLK